MAEPICCGCGGPLTYTAQGGWVHEGGTKYSQFCNACRAWTGPEPSAGVCPLCGSPDLRDTCVAVPLPAGMSLAETKAAIQAIDYEDAWGR